jgi:hypothetical protein
VTPLPYDRPHVRACGEVYRKRATMRHSRHSLLWPSWKDYAMRSGENPGTKVAFNAVLVKRNFEKKRGTGGVWIWRGIQLEVDEDRSNREQE